MRDFCDDYGTPKARKIPLQKDVASRVEALNSGRVHAGNALADAGMFIAREPFNAMAQFRRVYGINPQQIQALGKRFPLPAALLPLLTHSFKTLPADTFNSLLRVLDAVGASRYQARTMRKRACSSISSSSSSEGDCRKAEEMVKSAIDQEMFYRPFVSCPEGDDIENEG